MDVGAGRIKTIHQFAGTSTVEPVYTNYCYNTETGRRFSAQMQHGEDGELGWHSTCVFVGALTSDPEDVVDLSKTNELLLTVVICLKIWN